MKRALLFFTFTILLTVPSFAGTGDGKTFLIHAKTSLSLDDAQICAVPNVAWTALGKGYKVVILFDASAITAIKKGSFFGGNRTPLDKADLPERERETLSKQLGIPLKMVPHDYGEYIRFLKTRGVELYANETMMILYKITKEEIDPAIIPVKLRRMLEIFESADIYVAY
ncbi:hypothetical protein MNBD_NITROSPINAE01-1323 [hydrothermal vent metagenome]|uniref:Uncharacterized protein n=1 Tax=hydrothermal vent metagenome TaxID=652676 RepID=A0A3B1C1U9_9ZZZZ